MSDQNPKALFEEFKTAVYQAREGNFDLGKAIVRRVREKHGDVAAKQALTELEGALNGLKERGKYGDR